MWHRKYSIKCEITIENVSNEQSNIPRHVKRNSFCAREIINHTIRLSRFDNINQFKLYRSSLILNDFAAIFSDRWQQMNHTINCQIVFWMLMTFSEFDDPGWFNENKANTTIQVNSNNWKNMGKLITLRVFSIALKSNEVDKIWRIQTTLRYTENSVRHMNGCEKTKNALVLTQIFHYAVQMLPSEQAYFYFHYLV